MLGHDRTLATYFPDEWPRLAANSGAKGAEQFHTPRGQFNARALSLHANGTQKSDLFVVAHVPPSVLDGRAVQLLRRLLVLVGVILVLVLVLAWYLAFSWALRRQHERHLADSAERLHSLSARLLTAQEDERRSLSRDLHDELGQVVTSVALDLQRAAQVGDRERKDELIQRALHGANCLLDGIHEISSRLRPALLDDLGLKDAVQSLLSEYERRTGIITRAELSFARTPSGRDGGLPRVVSENVYRILQEALTNVSKHARANEVHVALSVGESAVALTVRDNGVGLSADAPDGKRLGIPGMRERVELLHGVFELKAEPGRGTEVQVSIPLVKEDAA
jgi:signal transduction histidine kinase